MMYYQGHPAPEFLEDIDEEEYDEEYGDEEDDALSDSDFELSDSEYPSQIHLGRSGYAGCCSDDDEGAGAGTRCPQPEHYEDEGQDEDEGQVPDYRARYKSRTGVNLGNKLGMRPFGGSGNRRKAGPSDMERMASDLQCPDEDESRCYMQSEPRFNPPPLHTNPQGRRVASERRFQSYNVSSSGRGPSTSRYANGQNRVLPGSGRSTQQLRGVMEDKSGHKYFVFQNKMPSRTTDKGWNHESTRLIRDRILMPDNGRRGINSNGDGVVWAPRPGANRSDPYMQKETERKAFDRYGRSQLENNMNGVFPSGSMRPTLLPPTMGKRWADYDRTVGWQPVSRTPTTLLQDPHPDVPVYHNDYRPGLERQTGSMPHAGRAGNREGVAGPGMTAARPHVMGDPDFRQAVGQAPKISLGAGGTAGQSMAAPSIMQSHRAPLVAGRDGAVQGSVWNAGSAPAQVEGSAQRNPTWMQNTRPNIQNVHQGQAGHGAIVQQGKERQIHTGRTEQNGVSFDAHVSMNPALVQQGSGNKRKFFAAKDPTSNIKVDGDWTQGSILAQRNPAKMQMLVNKDPTPDVQGQAHNVGGRGAFSQPKEKTQARLQSAPAPVMALRASEMNRGTGWTTGSMYKPKEKTQARLLAARGPEPDGTAVDAASMRPSIVQQGKEKQLTSGRDPTQDQSGLDWSVGRPDQIKTGTGLKQPIVLGREGVYAAADATSSAMRPSILAKEAQIDVARDPQPYRTDLGIDLGRPDVVAKDQNRGLENPQKLSLANGWTSVGYEARGGTTVRKGKKTVAARRPAPTRNVDPRGMLHTPVETRTRPRFRPQSEGGSSRSASKPQSVRKGKKGGATPMRWGTPQLPKGAAGWRTVAKYSHNYSGDGASKSQ